MPRSASEAHEQRKSNGRGVFRIFESFRQSQPQQAALQIAHLEIGGKLLDWFESYLKRRLLLFF